MMRCSRSEAAGDKARSNPLRHYLALLAQYKFPSGGTRPRLDTLYFSLLALDRIFGKCDFPTLRQKPRKHAKIHSFLPEICNFLQLLTFLQMSVIYCAIPKILPWTKLCCQNSHLESCVHLHVQKFAVNHCVRHTVCCRFVCWRTSVDVTQALQWN